MLRSSEIKPLFVDLSLCDKSFSFLYLKGVTLYCTTCLFFLLFFPYLSVILSIIRQLIFICLLFFLSSFSTVI